MSLYQSVDDYREAHHKQPGGAAARVQEVLDQLNGLGRRLDAVRFLDEGFAHEQAEQLAASAEADQLLAGVPLAHKELYGRTFTDRPGWPDEGGSKSYQGQTARRTATVINRLDAAGAI
ncbi:MAG: hypothetical protein VXW11_06060, partial [Pseudomonadota bacterium]|nr:hypothetical protein [Pseudomonadota bacterium]